MWGICRWTWGVPWKGTSNSHGRISDSSGSGIDRYVTSLECEGSEWYLWISLNLTILGLDSSLKPESWYTYVGVIYIYIYLNNIQGFNIYIYIYIYQILTTPPTTEKKQFSPQQMDLWMPPAPSTFVQVKLTMQPREKKGDVTSAKSSLQRGAKLDGTWAPQFSANLRWLRYHFGTRKFGPRGFVWSSSHSWGLKDFDRIPIIYLENSEKCCN